MSHGPLLGGCAGLTPRCLNSVQHHPIFSRDWHPKLQLHRRASSRGCRICGFGTGDVLGTWRNGWCLVEVEMMSLFNGRTASSFAEGDSFWFTGLERVAVEQTYVMSALTSRPRATSRCCTLDCGKRVGSLGTVVVLGRDAGVCSCCGYSLEAPAFRCLKEAANHHGCR
jgi:hypothetical protein